MSREIMSSAEGNDSRISTARAADMSRWLLANNDTYAAATSFRKSSSDALHDLAMDFSKHTGDTRISENSNSSEIAPRPHSEPVQPIQNRQDITTQKMPEKLPDNKMPQDQPHRPDVSKQPKVGQPGL